MATTNKAFRVKNGLTVEGAELRPAAGTTSYPPILLTSGTNLTSATAGAFEYDGTNFYLTPASTRKTISFTDHVHGNITSSGTIGSTTNLVVVTGASGAITVATATNQSSTTFLRGDLTWVTPTDTNYYPTAVTMTAGTTAGPTVDLTMSGTSNITGAAIPSASATASGVVTTGAQTFAGVKTMTSPSITTSLTTGSTSFDLVNTTATTVNLAGAGTSVNIGAATGNTTVNNSLVVTGNLTVNGTTTTVNSTTVTVDDIVLELGAVTSPTDTTANGGGISLLGATNKTILWDSTNANWTSSENWNLATGKVFKINNASVLSATTLGSAVVNSSLTKVGALSSGTAGFVKVDASGNLTSDGTTYAPLASPTFTGTPAAPTAAADTNTTQIATTAYVVGQGYLKSSTASSTYAPLASPALTGTTTLNSIAGLATATFTTSGTTAGSSSTVFSTSAYTGAEVILKAVNGTTLEIIKALLVIDSSGNVYVTQYADVQSGTQLIGTLDFTVTTGNVAITVTPYAGTTGTTTYKAALTLIAA